MKDSLINDDMLAHKYMEEFKNSLVCKNVQDIPGCWLNDGQSVDLVFE